MSEKVDIQKIISEETEKRLAQMQKPNYQFPKKIEMIDIVLIMASIGISGLLIILCMCGVIV